MGCKFVDPKKGLPSSDDKTISENDLLTISGLLTIFLFRSRIHGLNLWPYGVYFPYVFFFLFMRPKKIQETSGASLILSKKAHPNLDKKSVVISGTSDAITKCIDQFCGVIVEINICNEVGRFLLIKYCLFRYSLNDVYVKVLIVRTSRTIISYLSAANCVHQPTYDRKGSWRCHRKTKHCKQSWDQRTFSTGVWDIYSRCLYYNRGHTINVETPMLIFNILGTPDEWLLSFNVIYKKREKNLPLKPCRDYPPCFLLFLCL